MNNYARFTANFFGDSPAEKFRKVIRVRPKTQYIQTRFYYDVEDLDHFVILNQLEPVLRPVDVSRGYVDRGWVIKNFKHAIQHLRLTPRSCLVELCIDSMNADVGQKERARLYVR